MSANSEKLSCKKYLKENSERFSLVAFYQYFNFDTRHIGESALRGTVYALKKTSKRNKKCVNDLLNLLNSNNFEYLNNSAAEAFWSRVDARNSQVKRIFNQTRVQAESESSLLAEITEKEIGNEDKRAIKRRKYVLDISELQVQEKNGAYEIGQSTQA